MVTITEIKIKIERGINQFIAVCINANRDLPFHDYQIVTPATSGMYVVGSNNISGVGDQKKYFVSKSTLIHSTCILTIKINSQNNIAIDLLANVMYEFKSNIHTLFWSGDGGQDDYLKMYFEGVMYNEARRPE